MPEESNDFLVLSWKDIEIYQFDKYRKDYYNEYLACCSMELPKAEGREDLDETRTLDPESYSIKKFDLIWEDPKCKNLKLVELNL